MPGSKHKSGIWDPLAFSIFIRLWDDCGFIEVVPVSWEEAYRFTSLRNAFYYTYFLLVVVRVESLQECLQRLKLCPLSFWVSYDHSLKFCLVSFSATIVVTQPENVTLRKWRTRRDKLSESKLTQPVSDRLWQPATNLSHVVGPDRM